MSSHGNASSDDLGTTIHKRGVNNRRKRPDMRYGGVQAFRLVEVLLPTGKVSTSTLTLSTACSVFLLRVDRVFLTGEA